MPPSSQMRPLFHLHPRHRHTNMSYHTSPNLPLWHTINTSRQIPGPGTRYLRRSTGWQTAFSNNFNMLRCRSSRSARLSPAMEPPEFFIVFIYFTLFSLKNYDGTKVMAEQESPLFMLYRFQRSPIDQAFPGRSPTEKDKISCVSTNGLDRIKEVHCNTFHYLQLHGARDCLCRAGGVYRTCFLALSFRVGFIRDTRAEE
jgi:hypothetical protein